MRLRPVVAAVAAVMLLQTLAIAAPAKAAPVKAAKPVAAKADKPEPEFVKMMRDVGNEMTLSLDPKAHPGEMMDKLVAMKFTPATSALLIKYLGTDKLFDQTKTTHADGSATHNFWTPNVDQKLEAGQLKITPLKGVMKVDKAGSAYTTTAEMERVTFADDKITIGFDKLGFGADLVRGPHDFWMGTMWYAIDAFTISPAGKPVPAFLATGMRADIASKNQGDIAEVSVDGIIKSLQIMGQDAGSVRSKVRAAGLDLALMRKFADQATAMAKSGKQAKMDELQAYILFSGLAQTGATLHIDELAWSYKGHELLLKGTVGFAPGTKGKNLEETMKQAEGKLHIRVPVAMIKEVARAVAQNMPMGQPGQPVSEQQREQTAATFADMAIGKALGGGFFRMDGETLVTDIAFKGGKLSLNGKEVDLPKPQPKPQAQPPVAVKPKQ